MDVNGGQSHHVSHGGSRKRRFVFLSLKTASFALLISIAVLILAVASYAALGSPNSQSKYVDGNKFQVVFLSDGQFYFGRIRNLNKDFVRMTDIFYLQTNQQVQPEQSDSKPVSAPVLVPLGCELHRPQNQMVINREQVIWWENLKEDQPDNTVPGAIKKYLADNPNGVTCDNKATNTTEPSN